MHRAVWFQTGFKRIQKIKKMIYFSKDVSYTELQNKLPGQEESLRKLSYSVHLLCVWMEFILFGCIPLYRFYWIHFLIHKIKIPSRQKAQCIFRIGTCNDVLSHRAYVCFHNISYNTQKQPLIARNYSYVNLASSPHTGGRSNISLLTKICWIVSVKARAKNYCCIISVIFVLYP
jgi:hypothetical protein